MSLVPYYFFAVGSLCFLAGSLLVIVTELLT